MSRIVALTAALAAAVAVGGTSTAQAHLITKPKGDTLKHRLVSQKANMQHVRGVLRSVRRVPFVKLSKRHQVEVRFSRKAVVWLKREIRKTEAKIYRRSMDWRSYLLNLVGPGVYHGCALPLIGRESGGVVTKWNYQGSGAYGLGQALPAEKMAPYGSDYMTNGVTQIKWMNAYVRRYGGWCGANAYQLSNGYY